MKSRHTLLSFSSPALLGLFALPVLFADPVAQGSSAPDRGDVGRGSESAVVSRDVIDDFPRALAGRDYFGSSVAFLGDLDGDGRVEVAVGAPGDDPGGPDDAGAVYVLSMGGRGRVTAVRKIAPGEGGFAGEPGLRQFGVALEPLGDLDGDGVGDLAVGEHHEGIVWILFLNADATVKDQRSIAFFESFGSALATLGDLDGDGRLELAVGLPRGQGDRGSVSILSLNPDGTLHATLTIGQGLGGFGGTLDPGDFFSSGLSEVADLDGDGVPELAVGAPGDDASTGAVWIVFLNANGSVKAERKISEGTAGFSGRLEAQDSFGSSLASLDDSDGDGLSELAVGAAGTQDSRGAVWILFLDSTGGVKKHRRNGHPQGKFRAVGFEGSLEPLDGFGRSLAVLDDLDGDGVRELAVGASDDATHACLWLGALWLLHLDGEAVVKQARKLAPGERLPIPVEPKSLAAAAALGDLDDDGGAELALGVATDCTDPRGAVWIAHLGQGETVASLTRIAAGEGGFDGFLADGDRFGAALAPLGDLDSDGVTELAVGASGSDLGGLDRGVVWILFLEADGSVREAREIGQGQGGFPGPLQNGDAFGSALASAGDLDGDGLVELVAGAPGDDDGGVNRGAVWILFLEVDGSVSDARKLSQTQGGFPGTLESGDGFGSALAGLGDVDGDDVGDLAVGAPFHDTGDPDAGVVWTLLLAADGSVKGAVSFDPTQSGHDPREGELFGAALANLGDLDHDGRLELVVGAPGDRGDRFGGSDQGVLWAVTLAADGSASTQARATQTQLGLPFLLRRDSFGSFLAPLPDRNGDGVQDLAVGLEGFFRLWVLHQDGVSRNGSGHALPR